MTDKPRNRYEFEAALRDVGRRQYHDLHPFHRLLHGGKLSHGQLQAWALNRYYYQISIPRKDLRLMANMRAPELRAAWRQRVLDHDGGGEGGVGGIERWLKLTDGLALERDYVRSLRGLLPATRFAVDAYVCFVATHPTLDAIASSLTELFASDIHRRRIEGFERYYDFANDDTLSYFRRRLTEAPRDVNFGLNYVLDHANTRDEQDRCLRALTFKTELLWAQLDALHHAYVAPGLIPPGAFVPDDRVAMDYSR